MKWLGVLVCIALTMGLASCELVDRTNAAIEACNGMTLEELKTIDDLSDECREAVENILPSVERILIGKVVSAGIGEIDGNKLLFIMGEDWEGNQIDLSAVADVRITADGQAVPVSSYVIARASELNTTILSLSCILDYSGSMRDKDIDDAIEVYEALYSIPVGYEAEFTIFSVEIFKKTGFTTDRNVLRNALVRDDSFARLRTALFDVMGMGIQSLAARDAPVKLLIVATDGYENNSFEFRSESTLYSLANQNDIHIIVMGSLLADRDFMRRAADQTDGFYYYAKDFISLKTLAADFVRVLENLTVVEIIDSPYSEANTFQVGFADTTLTF